MMKCVLTLVFLFHLCHSVTISITLNREMVQRLSKLDQLYEQKKLNITSPENMRVPATIMDRNASACVGVFVRELKHFLDNVTVPKIYSHVLDELMANLDEVGIHKENDQECPVIPISKALRPFSPYKGFLRSLRRNSTA